MVVDAIIQACECVWSGCSACTRSNVQLSAMCDGVCGFVCLVCCLEGVCTADGDVCVCVF